MDWFGGKIGDRVGGGSLMDSLDSRGKIARFGLFQVNLQERVLTKNGVRIKVQEKPFQVLALLLERYGETVTREELKAALWSGDTFVEFDGGLNTAIKKLRVALDDPSDNLSISKLFHVVAIAFSRRCRPNRRATHRLETFPFHLNLRSSNRHWTSQFVTDGRYGSRLQSVLPPWWVAA